MSFLPQTYVEKDCNDVCLYCIHVLCPETLHYFPYKGKNIFVSVFILNVIMWFALHHGMI